MLGAVLVLMRQVQQPEAVELLDRVFTSPQANRDNEEAAKRRPLPGSPVAQTDTGGDRDQELTSKSREANLDRAWAEVKDNAMFLPAEHKVWFLLWEEARRLEPADLNRQSLGVALHRAQIIPPCSIRTEELNSAEIRESASISIGLSGSGTV